jgi:hypothetical protein
MTEGFLQVLIRQGKLHGDWREGLAQVAGQGSEIRQLEAEPGSLAHGQRRDTGDFLNQLASAGGSQLGAANRTALVQTSRCE